MSPAIKNVEPKAWLQELKTSRKLQGALVGLVFLLWLLWPTAAKPVVRGQATGAAPLGDRQSSELRKLPDLSRLDKAGELPHEDRMYRDLFTFDTPPPPPPKALPPPPPPLPPTPEQLAAELARRARDQEANSKPADLRYLGYLGTKAAGRLGAFMKGDEPVTIKMGELANPKWRLVKLTEASAEFQNLKYPDLKHRIDAVETQSGRPGGGATNEF